MTDHDDNMDLASYVGKVVHDRIAAPYVERIDHLLLDIHDLDDEIKSQGRGIDRLEEQVAEYEDEITSLKRSLHDVAAERDEMHVKWAEAERASLSNTRARQEMGRDLEKAEDALRDFQEFHSQKCVPLAPSWHGVPDPRATDPRGPHEVDCSQHWTHTGPCHEPVTKSAIEVPKPETDAGEGRVIAFLEMTELQPGMRFRLDNGKPFETVIHIERGVTSESIFNYDPDATVKITVAWGGSGHFRPDRVVQVDTGPHND